MIIKKINIIAFAGLKNKVLDFDKGINLVYGENERGKSSIQAFIKIWLFGMPSRGGLRKKYLPFTGESMEGEIYIEDKEKSYIVKRRIGKTKKEDTLEIINISTGETYKSLEGEEPGKYFLDINEKSFDNTLYISQLGVEVKNNKDDELVNKIQEVFSGGNGEVSLIRGIDGLENLKKTLSNVRKTGEIDKLDREINLLEEERFNRIKVVEDNLENEKRLIKCRKYKKDLEESLKELELYKKYLKRTILKKEYEDIFRYLEKSEAIKKEEDKVKGSLETEGGYISIDTLEELNRRLNLVEIEKNKVQTLKDRIKNGKEVIENFKRDIEEYEFFSSLDGKIKERLTKLEVEQENIKEKLKQKEKLLKAVEKEREEIEKRNESIGKVILLKDDLEEIIELEREYKIEKQGMKTNKEAEKNNLLIGIEIVLALFFIGNLMFLKNIVIAGILIVIIIGVGFLFYKGSREDRGDRETLENIKFIEERFNNFLKITNFKDYNELFKGIDNLKEIEEENEKSKFIIEERLNFIEELSLEDEKKYGQNKKIIDSILKMSNSDNMEILYLKLDKYFMAKREEDAISNENYSLESKIQEIYIDSEEKNIITILKKYKLERLYKEGKIESYLKEYREGILKIKSLEEALKNIEETYKTLLKGREIKEIEKDFENLRTIKSEYNYTKEEEVDEALKKNNKERIETEKALKDLESAIKLNLVGKRDMALIEEEIEEKREKQKALAKKLRAAEVAIDILKKNEVKIKEKFGPTLNKNIGDIFQKLTNNKYSDVILKDDYTMMVNDKERFFLSEFLSNGSRDQLYLALRLGFIKLLFENKEVPIFLDEVFLQYDDKRRENAIKVLKELEYGQIILFTCQKIEERIIKENNIKSKIIYI